MARKNIEDIAFEKNGDCWIATSDGLYFFDGYRWTIFKATNGLPSDSVRSVLVSRAGKLWVGTTKGVVVFDGKKFSEPPGARDGLAGPSVKGIYEDPDGTLWFCCDHWPEVTISGGLSSLSPTGKWKQYHVRDGLPSDHVYNYFRNSRGEQFVSTLSGFAQRVGERWQMCLPPTGDIVYAAETGDGQTLVSVSGTVYRERGTNWLKTAWDFPSPGNWTPPPQALVSCKNGEVWAAINSSDSTSPRGTVFRLARWNGNTFEPVSAPFTGVRVSVIKEAPDGSLWVAGLGMLIRWERNSGEWTEFDGLPPLAFKGDAGKIWFAGTNSAFRLKNETFQKIPGLRTNLVLDLQGNVWQFDSSDRIRCLKTNDALVTFTETNTGLATVKLLDVGASGKLWFCGLDSASSNRIVTYKNGVWSPVSAPKISEPIISGTSDPRNGAWYLTGSDRGTETVLTAWHLTATNQQSYSMLYSPGYPGYAVPSLLIDDKGGIWIYGLNGVFHFDAVADKLVRDVPEKVFLGVRAPDGDLWFGFTGYAEGESGFVCDHDGRWRKFAVPLLELEPYGFCTVADDGSVYFGGLDNICVASPRSENLLRHVTLPIQGCAAEQVVKTKNGDLWISVRVPGELHGGPGRQITLRFRSDKTPPMTTLNDVTARVQRNGNFQFTCGAIERFHLRNPRKDYKFSWRFDSEKWTPFSDAPANGLKIKNLKTGSHTFEIRAMDEGGDIDPMPRRATFEILPMPLQEMKWFKPAAWTIFGIVFFLAIAATARSVQFARATRQLKKANVELEQAHEDLETRLEERRRLAAELHDNLEQGLTAARLQLEAAREAVNVAPEAVQQHLKLAQQFVHQSQIDAHRSVRGLRSQLLENDGLVGALNAICRQLSENKNTRINVTVTGVIQNLPEIVEETILRIGQEAVTNALKYAKAKEISVQLSLQNGNVILQVEDDGDGFDPNHLKPSNDGHFGLIGMRERAKRAGGKLELKSVPGYGTKITVKLPATKIVK